MSTKNGFYQQLIGFIENKSMPIIMINVVIIVFVTLLPFNFRIPANFDLYTDLSWQEWATQFKRTVKFSDIVANIFLFMPLGLGCAAQLSRLRLSKTKSLWVSRSHSRRLIVVNILISLGAGFFLSLAVELGQIFLVSREASTIDLRTNSLGTLIGSFIFWALILGRPNFETLFARLDFLTLRSTQFKLMSMLWIGYLALMVALLVNVQDLTKLSNWDPDFPLLIGNEGTRDRPWKGQIDNFCIADQAWSRSQIDSFFQTQDSCSNLINADSLIAAYSFAEDRSSYPDLNGELPNLEIQTKDPSKVNQTKGFISPNRWFKTSEAATELNNRLQNSSQFTILTKIATADFDQEGPARIISLSDDHFWRNLTLAQWHDDLSLRVRMPLTRTNGKRPEIRINNFFADTQAHQLAIAYDGTRIMFYRDQIQNQESLYLGSEAALFWSALSLFSDKMYLNPDLDLLNQLVYYLVIFAPLGILWGITFNLLQLRSGFYLVLLLSGLIVPALLIEGLIATMNRAWSWSYFALGCLVMIASFVLTKFYLQVKLSRQKS